MLDKALERRIYKTTATVQEELRSLAETLGFLKAGPRDIIEIHTTVLEDKCKGVAQIKSQAYIEEGRTLLLELMGYVLLFYRNFYVDGKNGVL